MVLEVVEMVLGECIGDLFLVLLVLVRPMVGVDVLLSKYTESVWN